MLMSKQDIANKALFSAHPHLAERLGEAVFPPFPVRFSAYSVLTIFVERSCMESAFSILASVSIERFSLPFRIFETYC